MKFTQGRITTVDTPNPPTAQSTKITQTIAHIFCVALHNVHAACALAGPAALAVAGKRKHTRARGEKENYKLPKK